MRSLSGHAWHDQTKILTLILTIWQSFATSPAMNTLFGSLREAFRVCAKTHAVFVCVLSFGLGSGQSDALLGTEREFFDGPRWRDPMKSSVSNGQQHSTFLPELRALKDSGIFASVFEAAEPS